MTRATPDDWPALATLIYKLWQHEAALDECIARAENPVAGSVGEAASFLAGGGVAFLAWRSGVAVGVISLKDEAYHGTGDVVRAPFYFVDPAHRDGRVPRRLWEAAQKHVGNKPIQIWVATKNAKYARVMERWFKFKPVATVYERSPE